MFRLWKGRKDAENKTNNLNEKNTHEIKSQIENDGTNGTDLDKPGSHLIGSFATFSRSTILAAKRSVPMMM